MGRKARVYYAYFTLKMSIHRTIGATRDAARTKQTNYDPCTYNSPNCPKYKDQTASSHIKTFLPPSIPRPRNRRKASTKRKTKPNQSTTMTGCYKYPNPSLKDLLPHAVE